ncbi:methyl-accepting chemotaxis (MCP) signaling domain protein [Methyloversatilis sp. RAC08]|uniref:methyl-accepting chemotaxis protein n=1 Tax=Methyloversatilis sp. RAC08 TaxID=1842540 RepID=UPI00083E04B3|nr:Cache 3/Cache 2 fusion domain-containing protein [Methyloversatilis sp. RAC08]AOF80357.1 methyl-accepting chemotaxis (MCP) signaling domain protein [Methyloversatilis sp. RAC08]
MNAFSRLSVVHQLSISIGLLCAVIFASLIVIVSMSTQRSTLQQTEAHLGEQADATVKLLDLSYHNAMASAEKGMSALKRGLGGDVVIGEDTMPMGSYGAVRIARVNGAALNGDTDRVSGLRDLIGADPAIMVRVGDEFVRVATLLKDKDGKSMAGKAISKSKETDTLLAGKPYSGVVVRNGRFYISSLEPIKDASGNVVGALSARVDVQQGIDQLFASLKTLRIGDTGYLHILKPGESADASEMILHPEHAGKSIADIGNPALTSVIAQQLDMKNGQLVYDWPLADGSLAPKLATFRTSDTWGWMVSSGAHVAEFTAAGVRLRNQLIMICVGAALLLAALTWWLAHSRLVRLKDVSAAMTRLGNGDFSQRLAVQAGESRNELDLITVQINEATRKTAALITATADAARAVGAAARSLRAGSSEVVEGSTEQSSAAAGLAAAIEELSVSITHVADSAGVADAVSREARSAAMDGERQLHAVVDGMQHIARDINDASTAVTDLAGRTREISNVGRIIQEIAEQTNLLALNAAIEAARAGESGRGFAVVADEVRKLAERTAASTKEIASMVSSVQADADKVVQRISEVSDQVATGVSRATEAGAVLRVISEQSERTASAMKEIAAATREQSSASQSVAQGVERIAGMAEQNADVTRRADGETLGLEKLAGQLQENVGRFVV